MIFSKNGYTTTNYIFIQVSSHILACNQLLLQTFYNKNEFNTIY